MVTVTSSTNLYRSFDELNVSEDNGDYSLDGRNQSSIDFFQNTVMNTVEPTLVTLTASRIELRYNAPSVPPSDYRLIMTGSGIGPISTLDALTQAIGDGLASGGLNNISLTANGATLFSFALAPSGYTFTTGVDVIKLTGAMPTTFSQMSDLAELLGQLDTVVIDAMTAPARTAYFNDLADFGITGLSVKTGTNTLLSITATPTTATLSYGGMSLNVTGTFPNDFGAIATQLYEAYTEFGASGDPVDLSQLSGFNLNLLTITNAAGAELLRLTGPLTTGEIASHTITGTAGVDKVSLDDTPFSDAASVVINMLAGDDSVAFNTYDIFQRGYYDGVALADQQSFVINGGTGLNQLTVQNYAYLSAALVDMAAGTIQGFGQDTGDAVLYNAQFSNFQKIILEGSDIEVLGSSANDTVALARNFWGASVFFDGGAGTDTLDLSGLSAAIEDYSPFMGITRSVLEEYEIQSNDDGSVSMISHAVFGQPMLNLKNVESLIVLQDGSTSLVETLSVDTLLNTVYIQTGTAAAETLVSSWKNDIFYADGYRAAYNMDEAQSVYRLYKATLDRAPDTAGLTGWTEKLVDGSRSLQQVATGFVDSNEFKAVYGALSNSAFVELLYQNVLGRAADAGGLAGWVTKLDGGYNRAQVVTGFSESNEFRIATNTAATTLVQERDAAHWTDDVYRLYQATLDRAPDTAGLTGWSNSLANGTPFLTAVAGFVNSTEFQNTYGNLDNAGFVNLLYQNVLDRAADAGGLAGWVSRLDGGTSRASVVQGFSQSGEFISATAPALTEWVRAQGVQDVLRAGGGTNELWGGAMSDTFMFNSQTPGTNYVMDFEVWDYLSFENFDYYESQDAISNMTQSGADVVFEDQGTLITILNTQLSQITDDTIVL